MKKLPVGIQTFSEIRGGNYIYIDKTKEAYELIQCYKYAFLSRPRRFGKSLFLDTLRNIFEGKKEFFEGLYIHDKWDWETTYPVIKLSWDGKLRTIEDLEYKLKLTLKNNQERLGIACEEFEHLPSCLEELIIKAYQKYNQKVVVLIDEYDKPILDVIEEKEQALEHREYIKGLYSILKGSDEYLKFVFLTGVSKFSKASIFSGLNMLSDISLSPRFGNICGYTQADVERSFEEHLQGVDLEKVQNWYNGYYFLKDSVYNPFDLLKFIQNEFKFSNYWFASGTPTYLIKLIEKNNYFLPKLSNLKVGEELLDSFDVENIRLEVILYQSGYLTIDEMLVDEDYDFIEYTLKIPNFEVRRSLFLFIVEYLYHDTSSLQKTKALIHALKQSDLEALKHAFTTLFASLPYNNYTNNKIHEYEGFYASVIYAYLQSLGLNIIGEDVTNHGRIDLTVFIEDKVYIIEFKVNEKRPHNEALNQIKSKNYHQKYQKYETYLVGIEFCKVEKNICSFEWERIVQG